MTKAAALHLLSEFGPVLSFFVAGQFCSFETAAIILVIATTISLIASLYYEGRIPLLAIISGVLVIVSGLITYLYQAPDALILADSVYYFLLASIVGAGFLRGWLFLKWIFQSTFAMHDKGWWILSERWFYMFMFAGTANEIVRAFATPDFWVDYRFVKLILISGFGFYQFTLSKRYRIEGESNAWGLRITTPQESTQEQ